VATVSDNGAQLRTDLENLAKAGKTDPTVVELNQWWQVASQKADEDRPKVTEAVLFGGQQALKWTAYVPMAMAALYLLLVIIFKAQGGYRAVHLDTPPAAM